jgi:NAD-dependent deacetylase
MCGLPREVPMVEIALSDRLVELLRSDGPIVALTGAGVSAESGLATFRGPGGMWEGRDPIVLASPEAFHEEPETVWRFYAWRRRQAAAAEPNAGHRALAEIGRSSARLTLVTQNVDGLHERAGSREVVRLHGSLWRLRCLAENREFDDARLDLEPLPPRCACGGLLRPAVVWFGEALPADALAAAESAVRAASVVLVAGTSGMVYPAAMLPRIARAAGAWVVEINPERTSLSDDVDERLVGRSGEVLPAIAEAIGGRPVRR